MAIPTSLVMYAPLTADTSLLRGIGIGTYIRSSTATYLSNGLITLASVNEPRFEPEGYLTEGNSTNLVSYHVEYENAAWIKSGSTPDDSAATSPDGTTNASRVALTLGTSEALRFTSVQGNIDGRIFTASAWFKGEGSDIGKTIHLGIKRGDSGVDTSGENVIVLTGSWVRYEITITGVTSNNDIRIYFESPPTIGVSSALIFGAQIEERAEATSNIYTSGSTQQRLADFLLFDKANWPLLDTEFSIGLTISAHSVGYAFTVADTAGYTNRIDVDSSDHLRLRWSSVSSIYTGALASSAEFRIVVTWKSGGNQKVYIDTVLRDTDATVDSTNAITSLIVGLGLPGTNNIHAHLTELRIYDTELTQAEIDDELLPGGGGGSDPFSFISSFLN